MVSLHTNIAAMSALQSLRAINNELSVEQNKVSSGYRIATAADNAAYWSIATTMKSETLALETVVDAIGLSQAIVDTAYDGMTTAMGYLEEVRNLMVLARGMPAPTVGNFDSTTPNPTLVDSTFSKTELGKLDNTINQLLAGATTVIKSSSFAGVNMLYNSDDNVGINESGKGLVIGYANGQVQTIDTDPIATTLFSDEHRFHSAPPYFLDRGILDHREIVRIEGTFATWAFGLFNNHNTSTHYYSEEPGYNANPILFMERAIIRHGGNRAETYDTAINVLEEKIGLMKDGASYLGTIQSSLTTHAKLVSDRIQTYERGVGRLVDADMEESSSRIKALQVQQQLGIQALQISNAQPDILLQLFR